MSNSKETESMNNKEGKRINSNEDKMMNSKEGKSIARKIIESGKHILGINSRLGKTKTVREYDSGEQESKKINNTIN